MSSPAHLLKAIEEIGQAELIQLEQENRERVNQILSEAEETARRRRETAYQEALRPLAAERAGRLHEARMAVMRMTAAARFEWLETVQADVKTRLEGIRPGPQYKIIFGRLLEEAILSLGEQEMNGSGNLPDERPCLEVDPRDEGLAHAAVRELGAAVTIVPSLSGWGGLVLRSADGRIIVNNTLEARFTQVRPYLATLIPWKGFAE